MKLLRRKTGAFTLAEFLLALVIVATLVVVVAPHFVSLSDRGRGDSEILANARSLQQATQMMTLDSKQSGAGLVWTSRLTNKKLTPASLTEFLKALTDDGYMTESDLRKVLSVDARHPVRGPFTQDNIAFRIFRIDDDSPTDQPFLVSANWNDRKMTDRKPYGLKGFVFFTKGGGGGIRRRQADAASTDTFPTGSKDGHPYRYDTLD